MGYVLILIPMIIVRVIVAWDGLPAVGPQYREIHAKQCSDAPCMVTLVMVMFLMLVMIVAMLCHWW